MVTYEAVADDQEEEIESLMAAVDIEHKQQESSGMYLREQAEPSKKRRLDVDGLSKNLKTASQNIVVSNTLSEYRRLWEQFKQFCCDIDKVQCPDNVEALYPGLPADFPEWIAMWIMDKADDIDIFTGKAKELSISRVTYATAQKMRAAISHKYGRDHGLGTQPWLEDSMQPGHFRGNPSLSVTVSQYMISLGRRKVRAGEVVTSARAMDEQTMRELYEYNINFIDEDFGPTSNKRKIEAPQSWAGSTVRLMLQLMFVTAMLLLLRFEEVLRITWSDVQFEYYQPRRRRIRLMLPFRKTHQYGGIVPFFLYENPDKPWMCPVRAWAAWWHHCRRLGLNMNGYVFRKKMGRDGVSANAHDGMTADSFLECFRNNLLDIGIDPRPYGTHSFRRGGCQYLAMVLRWPLRQICTWGGWAENFDNPGTIFKYLLSWTDAPQLQREDYFNPDRAGSDPCTACGRTCTCA
ncbi:hypothetical protein C8R48DRAFT_455825 [Suillus tomentosus]|nr:hypothetical protein C8R48DRAFT_455825 [Suillus tomentosus]